MGQQSQQSQGQKGGMGQSPYGMQPAYGQGYGQQGYGYPGQQGSFFSQGGSNRPPMQTMPFQMGVGGFDPNKMIGVPDPWSGIGDAGPIPPGYGPGQNPYAMPGGANPLARGAPQQQIPQSPGVQTFYNGAYANQGQPQQPPAPNPGVQTFQNGAYAAQGLQPPNPYAVTNPLARPFTNGY